MVSPNDAEDGLHLCKIHSEAEISKFAISEEQVEIIVGNTRMPGDSNTPALYDLRDQSAATKAETMFQDHKPLGACLRIFGTDGDALSQISCLIILCRYLRH